MVVFRNRARRLTALPELLLTSPHWPGVRKQFPSILVLAHLLDGNPVLSFGWNIKLLGRFLDGFLCLGSLNGAEVFGPLANNIDAPAGHLQHCP
jgi:hypothetical protein